MYERTTTSQHIAVSSVLSGAEDSSVPSTTTNKVDIPTHSAMFASVSNCVINVNVTSPAINKYKGLYSSSYSIV